MAFRGFGDDAMKVAADQRQHAAQMAQIAASERASQRAASVALAGQAEGAREFDERQTLAREQMSAEQQNAEAGRQFSAEQAELSRTAAAEEAERGRAFTAKQTDLARQDAFAKEQADNALKERQMQINEATFNQLNTQWQQEREAQQEMLNRENAATLAALRVAATASDGMVPPLFLNAINEARGVVADEPGSITQLFSIRDSKTGERQGFGSVEIDKDGNQIQKALDPRQVLPKMFAQMKPADSEKLARDIIAGGSTSFDDKMALMAKKHVYDMEKETEITQRSRERELTNPKQVEAFRNQEAELMALMDKDKKAGKPVDARTADLLRMTQEKIRAVTAAGMGGAGEDESPVGSGATLSGDMVTVTIDGQTKTVKDSPALRKWLADKGISIR